MRVLVHNSSTVCYAVGGHQGWVVTRVGGHARNSIFWAIYQGLLGAMCKGRVFLGFYLKGACSSWVYVLRVRVRVGFYI